MIITTSDSIPGKNIVETIGLVKGNTARARNVGKDIMAFAKNITGGEVLEYTKLISEAREQAIDRMVEQAERMGANAVCTVRFSSSSVAGGIVEVLAYGTAVKAE